MRVMKTVFLASISFSAYEYLPYPVGVLISYCKKAPEICSRFRFLDPEYRSDALDRDDFHDKLKESDFLGLTNWVWNQNYNDRIAKLFKKYRPDGIVIYGGTNVPEDKAKAQAYAEERQFVDIFFSGPAEVTFKNFLLEFDTQGLKNVPGTYTRSSYNVLKSRDQYKDQGIPMPYLDGTFERIINEAESPLTAVFETNRGCPYRCSFCDWGGLTKSKIVRAETQPVKETISYIFSKEKIRQIEIADANFGIFDVDVDYMQHMVNCQRARKNKIDLVFGGMAKNGSPHSEKIMEMTHENFDAYHGRKYVKFSFQSHDPEVLEVAQRSNIKTKKLFELAKSIQKKGIDIDSEMIIGLPGETQKKWLNTIQVNMELKVNHQKSFVLFVVPNTDLASEAFQKKYKIKTKKVLVPHDLYSLKSSAFHRSRETGPIHTTCDFQDPNDYQSFEFICECFSYDSQELMAIYEIWFWFNTLYNAKVARDQMLGSSLSAEEQYLKFRDLIDKGKMPFFAGLLKQYQYAIWNTLVKPEATTKIKDLFLANFLLKFGARGTEIHDIYFNQRTALEELRLIYPSLDFAHFGDKDTLRKQLQLYFVAADLTH